MKTFACLRIEGGIVARLWVEAESEASARELCVRCGFGFVGLSEQPRATAQPVPEAYEAKTASAILGGLSRSTLYRMVIRGDLDRFPSTKRLLITRSSLERSCGR
jgi:hypothetical protein